MEPMPIAESTVEPKPSEYTRIEATQLQEFERLETQQYQLVLPEQYEQLRGYLANDGLLSDEEITRCLYDETLKKADLAKRIEERTQTAPDGDRTKLTDYLWEIHETVKGLPLSFIDSKEKYRIEVVDTPGRLSQTETRSDNIKVGDLNPSQLRSQVSPVTLHLDINGGFLANFLHNAQLNHEQMSQFITDLERQHKELKGKLQSNDLLQPIQEAVSEKIRPVETPSYQLLQESGPSLTAWQRLRQSVSDWIAPAKAMPDNREPYEMGRQPDSFPKPSQVGERLGTFDKTGAQIPQPINAQTSQGHNSLVAAVPALTERHLSAESQSGNKGMEPKPALDGATITAGISLQSTTQSIANNQTQVVSMNETNTQGVEIPVMGRQTRYQWADVATQFEKVGVTRQDLEKAGHLDDLLNGRKTGLMKLTQVGEEGKPFQISGKLYIVNTPDNGPIVGIQPERKQLLLPKEFLGYELTARDKQNLEKNGEMGKRVDLTDKMTGKPFVGYIGVDKDTKSLTVLRTERLHIPQTIKGVTLTKPQQKNLEQGRAIKLEGMTGNNGQTFNAYVQVSAAKRSLTFAKIPDNAVKQTVDQKTAKDLTKPVHQFKGDGAGGKKTIQPKSERRPEEVKQTAAQRVEVPKPAKQKKQDAPKPIGEEAKPKKAKKQKGPKIG
ncbi:DUF3945 domain-containing protein [Spirosoma linguale]|uniref:DUF3945 domain-containing protein n=1 Tax=Spirosoma linguale (strain ATCC 33905 / DSM 74 / LMG 10896 / Claus 1) TaxID=504472 RepID=D2QV21_SPILD|nr:hypothetical protein Slin_6697 [Spirosoma linguale DSM 74]